MIQHKGKDVVHNPLSAQVTERLKVEELYKTKEEPRVVHSQKETDRWTDREKRDTPGETDTGGDTHMEGREEEGQEEGESLVP